MHPHPRFPRRGLRLARAAASVALFALTGCTTLYSWQASVPLPGFVGALCIEAALDTRDDIVQLTRTGEDRVAFELKLPDRKPDERPSFSLHSTTGIGEPPTLHLTTSYKTSLFGDDSEPQITAARELIRDVAEKCTGQRPELGPQHPCGKGEPHDLCVEGR